MNFRFHFQLASLGFWVITTVRKWKQLRKHFPLTYSCFLTNASHVVCLQTYVIVWRIWRQTTENIFSHVKMTNMWRNVNITTNAGKKRQEFNLANLILLFEEFHVPQICVFQTFIYNFLSQVKVIQEKKLFFQVVLTILSKCPLSKWRIQICCFMFVANIRSSGCMRKSLIFKERINFIEDGK